MTEFAITDEKVAYGTCYIDVKNLDSGKKGRIEIPQIEAEEDPRGSIKKYVKKDFDVDEVSINEEDGRTLVDSMS